MKISIYTITMGGRERYLHRLLSYLVQFKDANMEFVICLNGIKYGHLSKPIKDLLLQLDTRFVEVKKSNVETCMNAVLPLLAGDLIIKLDDDALPYGEFFTHVRAIATLKPNLVFSPYPVGLINNPGGVLSNNREVIYSNTTDTYYTLRYVTHIGGFARISPNFVKGWTFNIDQSHTEDAQHSAKCVANGIQMAYLENALIVEHQESTLGQHRRYPDYFEGRF